MGKVALANVVTLTDQQFDVQVIVLQQHATRLIGIAAVADETFAPAQLGLAAVAHHHDELACDDLVPHRVGMAADRERHRLVEEFAHVADDLLAADRVVPGGFFTALHFENDIGAIERIVKTVPARIGSIQRVARVVHRHHQLRTGDHGDLVVDVFGRYLEFPGFRQQVSDLLEEGLVLLGIDLARVGFVPVVDLGLQPITLVQQFAILRSQFIQNTCQRLPELFYFDTATRGDFLDQLVNSAVNA